MEKSKVTVGEITSSVIDKGKDVANSVGEATSVVTDAVEAGKEKGLETAVRQMVHTPLYPFHSFIHLSLFCICVH